MFDWLKKLFKRKKDKPVNIHYIYPSQMPWCCDFCEYFRFHGCKGYCTKLNKNVPFYAPCCIEYKENKEYKF